MLLRRDAGQSFIDARELERRCELFRREEWLALLHQASRAHPEPRGNTAEASESARAARAVRLGELSAAARALQRRWRQAPPRPWQSSATLSGDRQSCRFPSQMPRLLTVLPLHALFPLTGCWPACEARGAALLQGRPEQLTSTCGSSLTTLTTVRCSTAQPNG